MVSTMVNHDPTSYCDKYFLNMKIKHDPMSRCDNNRLDMKINYAWPWSNIVLWQRLSQYDNEPWSIAVKHVYFRVYNIHLWVYIPWVYNINPLGLIFFSRVYNILDFRINPLCLLFPWIYNIDPLSLLI